MTDRTNIGVKATAKQQTVFLDSEQLLQYMEPAPGEKTFSFSELSTGSLDVYLVLPATHTVNYKRWLRMMVNQSMRAVLRNGVRDIAKPVTYFLDEAGTSLGHLDAIESAYGLTSGMGVLCWSFYQNISQMKRDYPHSWQTFIANSATIQLLRVGDLETAKYFSEHLGQSTRGTVSTWYSSNAGPGGRSAGNSTTFSETGRAVLMPDEMMRIPDDEMIVLYAGKSPLQQYKIRYFQDARFNGYYRMDPRRQTSFPAEVPMSPHPASGEQGWWIRIDPVTGIGNATFLNPMPERRKMPLWGKVVVGIGALSIVLVMSLLLLVMHLRTAALQQPHGSSSTPQQKTELMPGGVWVAVTAAEREEMHKEGGYKGFMFANWTKADVTPDSMTLTGTETLMGRRSADGQTILPVKYRNMTLSLQRQPVGWKAAIISIGPQRDNER